MKIKKGDEVVVISGKYKGVKGKVLEARPTESRVVVAGVNRGTLNQHRNKQVILLTARHQSMYLMLLWLIQKQKKQVALDM